MELNRQDIGALEARFIPETVDVEARTVEMVFSTETPFRRTSWRGTYDEILSHDPAHVRLERMRAGAPFCDNHDIHSSVSKSVLGVVEEVRLEGNKLIGKVRFSKRENAETVFQDIVDGILRNISVGYRVYEYAIIERDGGVDEYRAIDWEPFEASTVPAPADYTAQVRAAENIISRNSNSNEMEENNHGGAPVTTDATTPQNPTPAPAAPLQVEDNSRSVAHERERVAYILDAGAKAGMPTEQVRTLIDAGTPKEQAAVEIVRAWSAATPPATPATPEARVTGDDAMQRKMDAMSEAIAHRAGGLTAIGDHAREYRSLSPLGMARLHLRERGVKVDHLGDQELARRAFHTSSDFPLILGNTVNRTLRAAYEQAPRTFQAFTRRQTVNDFRTVSRVSLSNMVGDLLYVPEGGEYKHATLSESAETYRVLKYGRIINVSWETLVNDDLDAFGRVPQAMANKAASLQSNIVYSLLTGAPVLSDGVALFNAAHSNLAASGGAITLATLGAARAAMSKQTDPSGDYLNITPRFLIVGPDREVEAQQILSATLVPSATTAVNPFVNSLTLIVDPRIGSAWYLAAAPAAIDTLEYAFLDGEELFTETERGFDVDGTRIKVRMVMGAAAIDHRGLYKNPGA